MRPSETTRDGGKPYLFTIAERDLPRYMQGNAPIAQLDRALPSEGRGLRFESSWVRHLPDIRTCSAAWLQVMCFR